MLFTFHVITFIKLNTYLKYKYFCTIMRKDLFYLRINLGWNVKKKYHHKSVLWKPSELSNLICAFPHWNFACQDAKFEVWWQLLLVWVFPNQARFKYAKKYFKSFYKGKTTQIPSLEALLYALDGWFFCGAFCSFLEFDSAWWLYCIPLLHWKGDILQIIMCVCVCVCVCELFIFRWRQWRRCFIS